MPLRFLTSLGIGLLLGLQRQRTPNAKAGLRTFALVALFGTMSGLIADVAAGHWIIAAGLVLAGLMIMAAYRHGDEAHEADSGTTTVIAVLLCYGLGVMVWYGHSQLAVAICIVGTALLQFKAELHGFSESLSRQDVTSILQFGVLSFIILPLLPNEGYGPQGALNPYHIWLMVVLVSGISLAGYLALRLLGAPTEPAPRRNPYALLWGERRLVSVANLTRADGIEFLELAPKVPIRTTVEPFTLERANQALARLREGQITGAAVLVMDA